VSALVRLRVTARSTKSELIEVSGTTLHIRVHAPPVDGEANKAVIELVAKLLGTPKSRIRLKSGASSRDKTLEISDARQDAIDRLIAEL